MPRSNPYLFTIHYHLPPDIRRIVTHPLQAAFFSDLNRKGLCSCDSEYFELSAIPYQVLTGAEDSGEPQYHENCLRVLYYAYLRSTYLASHILYTYKCEVVRLHVIKEYRGSRGTAPLGLNLGARWGKWSPSHFGRFIHGERTPAPIVYEAGWSPDPLWTFVLEGENSFPSAGI